MDNIEKETFFKDLNEVLNKHNVKLKLDTCSYERCWYEDSWTVYAPVLEITNNGKVFESLSDDTYAYGYNKISDIIK